MVWRGVSIQADRQVTFNVCSPFIRVLLDVTSYQLTSKQLNISLVQLNASFCCLWPVRFQIFIFTEGEVPSLRNVVPILRAQVLLVEWSVALLI